MEMEQRLTVLSLLPFKPHLASYPKWAQGKALAKLVLPSANPAEPNNSQKGLDAACSQAAQELQAVWLTGSFQPAMQMDRQAIPTLSNNAG